MIPPTKLTKAILAWAETLEIILNAELVRAIEAGTQDITNKKTLPVNAALGKREGFYSRLSRLKLKPLN